MGFGIKELVVVLVIVALVFGTKKIKGVGSDVGGWIRDFKKAMKEEPSESDIPKDKAQTIEAEVSSDIPKDEAQTIEAEVSSNKEKA